MAGVNISSVVGKHLVAFSCVRGRLTDRTEQLEGSLVRERDRGLEDLKYLLASSRNGAKLNALGDDGFHRILESLYRIARTDKATYLKAAQTKSKTPSTNRLVSAATALRLTVEAGVSKVKFKTAISVIDHIISILPTPDDDFIEPLRNDYLKCFRVILDYPPHGEHLKPKQWQEYVDFAIAGVSVSLGDDEQESNHLSGRDTSMSSRNGSHLSIRVSQGQRSSRYAAKSSLDDILSALRALSDVANAPMMTRASSIINSMLDALISSNRGQALALEVFNNVALVLTTENVELLLGSLSRLVPLLHRLWSTKAPVLRDQILVTFSICRPLFLADSHAIGYLGSAPREKVLNILQSEYIERSSRDMLQFDDMAVELLGFDPARPSHRIIPRRESPRALANWSLVDTLASLHCGLSWANHRTFPSDPDEQPRKRRKVTTPLDEVFQKAAQSDGSDRLAAIQILFFCYDQPFALPGHIEESIPALEPGLQSDDHQLAVWTILLFSR